MVKNIAIVSLSSGMLGEDFAKHEIPIGVKRLEEYGIHVTFMEHALKGIDYLKNNPMKRAEDLLKALSDESIDMILCAIGGDDTYRLLPYLFENDELKKAVRKKIFLGFSDTTVNHFMLHNVGLNTFYGQAFAPDICELDQEMLPYSKKFFEELITTGKISKIIPSEIWYEERTDFGPNAIGTSRISHTNTKYELLQGPSVFTGEILGGCIDTIFDIFDNERYEDSVSLCEKYHLFPTLSDWKGKILLLESSEEQPTPEKYRKMIRIIKNTGIFDVINGVLIGKPMDEKYAIEYKNILKEEINNPKLSILYNINVGHATPRCIIPFGVRATVDANKQEIIFDYESE